MALIVITIFCLCFVVAIFGWWTLLLIPLFIGAAILDGIIKDNDAQKRAEREREQAYRDRIENADFNIGFFNKEEYRREKAAAVKDYMTYCRKTEYKLSLQTGWKARRTHYANYAKGVKNGGKNTATTSVSLKITKDTTNYETEEILDGRYGVIF